jgi:hypothetical protein
MSETLRFEKAVPKGGVDLDVARQQHQADNDAIEALRRSRVGDVWEPWLGHAESLVLLRRQGEWARFWAEHSADEEERESWLAAAHFAAKDAAEIEAFLAEQENADRSADR